MKRTLTVTIPSYRQPQQLDRALYALTQQTFKDFNVIVIDDNSNIDLASIIKPYKDLLDISLVVNEKNLGAMGNMLNSITFATDAEYVFSHHEDDYIKCNYLEEAVKILNEHSQVSFVLSSPVWVLKDTDYQRGHLLEKKSELLTAENFMTASLLRRQFVFGSVIYRKKDIVGTLDMKNYHVLCDKIFLSEILLTHETLCGYIEEPAIYVRDHSKDEKDGRGDGALIEHVINYFNYYKNHLPVTPENKTLITNNLLLGYTNLSKTTSLFELYAKQKKYHLLSVKNLDKVGLYSLLSLLFGRKILQTIFPSRFIKKIFTL